MNKSIQKQINNHDLIIDDTFLEDTLSLFSGQNSGHMNGYAFNQPLSINDPVRGGEYWTKFIDNSSDYYLIKEESQIIRNCASRIAKSLPVGATYVDLGSGEDHAILEKTIPFIKSLKSPSKFISIDVNSDFAENAARLVKIKTNIDSHHMTRNFLTDSLDINSPAIYSIFGGLLCNLPKGKGEATKHLSNALSSIRRNVKVRDFLIITQDTNHNQESLMKAYNHPLIGKYILSILHKIKRDLPTYGFHPENFEFVCKWDSDNNLIKLNARAKKLITFKINNTGFALRKGQTIPLVNSYKFPVEQFLESIYETGFKSKAIYKELGNNTALHLLEAV